MSKKPKLHKEATKAAKAKKIPFNVSPEDIIMIDDDDEEPSKRAIEVEDSSDIEVIQDTPPEHRSRVQDSNILLGDHVSIPGHSRMVNMARVEHAFTARTPPLGRGELPFGRSRLLLGSEVLPPDLSSSSSSDGQSTRTLNTEPFDAQSSRPPPVIVQDERLSRSNNEEYPEKGFDVQDSSATETSRGTDTQERDGPFGRSRLLLGSVPLSCPSIDSPPVDDTPFGVPRLLLSQVSPSRSDDRHIEYQSRNPPKDTPDASNGVSPSSASGKSIKTPSTEGVDTYRSCPYPVIQRDEVVSIGPSTRAVVEDGLGSALGDEWGTGDDEIDTEDVMNQDVVDEEPIQDESETCPICGKLLHAMAALVCYVRSS